jgi:hypothetical protein
MMRQPDSNELQRNESKSNESMSIGLKSTGVKRGLSGQRLPFGHTRPRLLAGNAIAGKRRACSISRAEYCSPDIDACIQIRKGFTNDS